MRVCDWCGEEILPGDVIYSGVKEYHKDCLEEMSVQEFLDGEDENLEIAYAQLGETA